MTFPGSQRKKYVRLECEPMNTGSSVYFVLSSISSAQKRAWHWCGTNVCHVTTWWSWLLSPEVCRLVYSSCRAS